MNSNQNRKQKQDKNPEITHCVLGEVLVPLREGEEGLEPPVDLTEPPVGQQGEAHVGSHDQLAVVLVV